MQGFLFSLILATLGSGVVALLLLPFPRKEEESFVESGGNKFFVLQKSSTDFTMSNLRETTKIGYVKDYHRHIFEKVYAMFNEKEEAPEPTYVKLEDSDDLDTVDILLYVNDGVYIPRSKYKHVDFYMQDKKSFKNHFSDLDYVVYTDNNNSVYVLAEFNYDPDATHHNIVLTQSESLSKEYNFVLEYAINGKYHEVDMNTNRIVLYQNTILDLQVRVGDRILLRNQRYEFMNGVYTVTKVNNYIHMESRVSVPSKREVCIDEDLNEHPEYLNKYTCEFENDLRGVQKDRNMVWDARCRRNQECPFFDTDDHYAGQCNKGGYCDMPYDVEQISFTKYRTKQ